MAKASNATQSTDEARVRAAAAWLRSDDGLYDANPNEAERVARGMLAAADKVDPVRIAYTVREMARSLIRAYR